MEGGDDGYVFTDDYYEMLEAGKDPIPRPTPVRFEELRDRFVAASKLMYKERPRSPTREERINRKQEIDRSSLTVALSVYAKQNSIQPTKLELVEVKEKNIVAECGKRYAHFNFLVKCSDGPPTLFFAEVLPGCGREKAVYLCTPLKENDSGHCSSCNEEAKNLLHPICGGYLGGHEEYSDRFAKEVDSDEDCYI